MQTLNTMKLKSCHEMPWQQNQQSICLKQTHNQIIRLHRNRCKTQNMSSSMIS